MTDFTSNNFNLPSRRHPIVDLAEKLAERLEARRNRRELRALNDLEDHLLDDIGLTRDDVDRTLGAPNASDAATELHRLAYLNRASKM